jgi:hypothetical protein
MDVFTMFYSEYGGSAPHPRSWDLYQSYTQDEIFDENPPYDEGPTGCLITIQGTGF